MFIRSRLISLNLYLKRKFSTDPCTGCEIPCTKHASCPPEILKQIDQGNMINSVDKHSRHLCIGQSISTSQWPKDVKDLPGDYIKQLAKLLKEKQNSIGYSVKLTSVSIPPKTQSESTADWYLFPDQLKLTNVHIKQIEHVVDKLFLNDQSIKDKTKTIENQLNGEIKYERLNGLWILVCCHYQRDQRCGMSNTFRLQMS
jgi:hypothetical protein